MRKALLTIRILLWTIVFMCPLQALAQDLSIARQTLSTTSGSYLLNTSVGQFQVQQSTAQSSVIGLVHTVELQVRQGFIQPMGPIIRKAETVKLDWKVFPNPFTEAIQLQSETEYTGILYLSLCDLSGREVQNWQLEGLSSYHLRCTDLPIGSYLLVIRNPQSIQTIQLVRI